MTPADPRNTFGPAAERYASSAVHRSPAALGRLIELVRPSGGRVLDIATGSGHTAHTFAPYVDEVLATDITEPMLRICRREAVSKGLSNLTILIANGEVLPFQDGSFDGVTCRLAPHHFPSVESFVSEVYRVLKPGGWFLLVDTVGPNHAEAARNLDEIERMRDPSHVSNLSLKEWQALLEDAGFRIRTTSETSKELDAVDWMERTATPEELKPVILHRIQNSQGELREYLNPSVVDSCPFFELREGLLLSDK
jgi:ubiquinone/menaquinone biosynthesis C-methylase UbiE